MAALSSNKCWYSEVRLAPSELEIDHFRPKGRIATVRHDGYWWLAFNWRNFRLAYSLINKRRRDVREGGVQGKGSFFPLEDESKRAVEASSPLTQETPILLDPTIAADVMLLAYAVEDGKVVEASSTPTDIRFRRARASIGLFHLNEGTLIRDRAELCVAINNRYNRIEELITKRDTDGISPEEESDLTRNIQELSDMITASARFSAFCRACLLQKGDRGWNTVLLAAS